MAGIYLHIPFCKHRCAYCGFFSSTDVEWREAYVSALCRELEMRRHYAGDESISTVYLGGGTPSQLSLEQLERLFDQIYKVYRVETDAEVTLEVNPDDLRDEYASALGCSLPINRLSMGVQTFNDERLRFLKRRHTAAQAIEAVERCRRYGFSNLSVDLIYGLPGETLGEWEHDLCQALSLNVPHLSAYHLTYEEGTPLWQWKSQGKVDEVDEEVSAAMYAMLVEQLTRAGYEHYEISNFCRPGMESRHNSSYWKGVPYIGCGAAAHSFDGKSRQWNVSSIPYYIEGIRAGEPQVEREELDLNTRYNDYLVTAMRTRWGASLEMLKTGFGTALHDYCLRMARRHIRNGLLQIDGDALHLTEKGVFLSDGVISDLLWVE
ncbi:MAG: radical SAM family heme chaperone HemW [Bacteroidaceae bacterium]|nr:radical SAM family heme chaperone HemW [Bacteroidaceae bacterium]